MRAFTYAIDVLSACNLRCPSCPVENMRDLPTPKTLMSPEAFEAIVIKIKRETPGAVRVDMYNWAEPLLHPRLPRLLAITRRHGLPVGLSCNFNAWGDLEEVLGQEPESFHVSVSGFFQETYERTHPGGDIEKVKTHLRHLRETVDRCGRRTRVRVTYYCYIDNLGEDYGRMRDLCRSLGFMFVPLWAYLMPVEKLLDVYEGRPLSEGDRGLLALLAVAPEDARPARRAPSPDCVLRSRRTSISSDGSVALCCGVYDRTHNIAPHFLEASFDELQERKYAHPLCRRCMGLGVNDILLYSDFAAWNRIAAARIRPQSLPWGLRRMGWYFAVRRRTHQARPGLHALR